MPTYKQLNQRHPSYDERLQCELEALYEGGSKLEAQYQHLLPQRDRERDRRYQVRLKEAEYRNYLGPIIDYFTSMLFVSRPVLKPKTKDGKDVASPGEYWQLFREDCDRSGTDVDSLYKSLLTNAMVSGTGWVRLHQPQDGQPPPESAADFETRKLGDCWLELLPAHAVHDWETDELGALEWVIIHKHEAKRRSISGERDWMVETWTVLTATDVETYRVAYDRKEPPKPDDEISKVGTVPHSFGRVPLLCLDLSPALWVANRLRSPQLAHFRKVSAMAWSLASTAYAMPVAKVGDPEAYQKQTSGAGYEIIIHRDDFYEWEAPPTGHFAALDQEIKAEKDEIFRVAHQMALGVENNAAAVGRSAESKASDMESTRVVLVAFSRIVKETIELTLDTISRARGEDYEWSVEGLDDFAALDVDAFLQNLALLNDKVGAVPSKTFAIEANKRVAEALLRDVDEATKQKIREEIVAGTRDPVAEADAERELELKSAEALFAKPKGAERPGEDPAKAKPGAGDNRGRPS